MATKVIKTHRPPRATGKKKRARAGTDQALQDSLITALRRDAAAEAITVVALKELLLEVQKIRAVLEQTATVMQAELLKYNLPAVKKPARRKGKAIK